MTAQTSHGMPTAAERNHQATHVAEMMKTPEIDRAAVLAESLRAIRATAAPHWNGNGRRPACSLQVSHAGLSDLDDAADMLEKLAAALLPLANAAAPIEREMLTDAQVERAQAALYGADDPHLSARFEGVV